MTDASSWTDGTLARDAFFFGAPEAPLFGSVHRAAPLRRGIGFVVCGPLSLEALKSQLVQRVAAEVARLGGAALSFHYAGTGDSFGTAAAGFDDLRRDALAALAEARRRLPGLRWGLAGISVGAAVAASIAREAGVEDLLLLEPALDPELHAEELRRDAQRANFNGLSPEDYVFGAPVPDLRVVGREAPVTALARYDGRIGAFRSADRAPATPLPDGLELVDVPGAWMRQREEAPALVEAARAWVEALPAEDVSLDVVVPRSPAVVDGIVERAVYVETHRGPIGALLTEPEGPPRAQLLFLHGNGDPRSGVNAHWTRTARAFARLGLRVLRADWAGKFESDLAHAEGDIDRPAPVPELGAWLRARDAELPTIVLGSCYGATVALIKLAELEPVAALGLIVPPLYPPQRRFLRVRNANAPDELDPHSARVVARAVGRIPLFLLTGDGDGDYARVVETQLGPRKAALVEQRVVQGATLHGFHTRHAQEEGDRELVAWVERVLATIS